MSNCSFKSPNPQIEPAMWQVLSTPIAQVVIILMALRQCLFLDYSDVVANKSLIKFNITNNIMPPWAVDNIYRKMADKRSVSAIEEAFED